MRDKANRYVLVSALMGAILLMAGCSAATSIAEINKDPGRFAGKDITVRGTVAGSFGAMSNGVFQLDDGSGRMLVYSQNFGVPAEGNKITVTGRVEQGLAFGGRTFGLMLRETEAWR